MCAILLGGNFRQGEVWGQCPPPSTHLSPRFEISDFKLFALKLDNTNIFSEAGLKGGSGKLNVVLVFEKEFGKRIIVPHFPCGLHV